MFFIPPIIRVREVLQQLAIEILRKYSPPSTCHMSHITYHISCVTCHMARVTCNMSIFFSSFSDKMVKLVGEGSVINRAYHA